MSSRMAATISLGVRCLTRRIAASSECGTYERSPSACSYSPSVCRSKMSPRPIRLTSLTENRFLWGTGPMAAGSKRKAMPAWASRRLLAPVEAATRSKTFTMAVP